MDSSKYKRVIDYDDTRGQTVINISTMNGNIGISLAGHQMSVSPRRKIFTVTCLFILNQNAYYLTPVQ